MSGMEKLTQRAKRVLSIAHQEAERQRHSYVGTEHVLLGLIMEEGGVAARVLRELGLETQRVKELVERFGHYLDKEGFQPISGRIMGLLTVMDKEAYTFDEICQELNISKASASSNLSEVIIQYLEFCEIDKNLSQNTIRMYDFYLKDFFEKYDIKRFLNHASPKRFTLLKGFHLIPFFGMGSVFQRF